MRRVFPSLGVLVLAAASLVNAADQHRSGGAPASRPASPPPAQNRNPVEKFSKLPAPAQKQELKKLPPDARRDVERKLDGYKQMPPDQRQVLNQTYQRFQQLPPERQKAVLEAAQEMRQLSPERQTALRKEFQKLMKLSPEKRQTRLNGDEFRNKYSASELRALDGMVQLAPQ